MRFATTVAGTVSRGEWLFLFHVLIFPMAHTFTTYYVTFQVESGDRMELTVSGSDYGMLVEGDIGKLSFQGTSYLGFERS